MKYYLYTHIREDKNEVFYVGIGTRSSQDLQCDTYSRATSNHIDNSIWMKIVAKTAWYWNIICIADTRKEVEDLETEYIIKYGRKFNNTGTLANFTIGGERNTGYKHTEETKKKISDAQIGKTGRRLGTIVSAETKEKIANAHKVIANTPEAIEYRRELAKGNSYHLGHKNSEESKKLMSIKAKERGLNGISYKCNLIDKETQEVWEANSIIDLAKITPVSLSTLNRLSQGIKISDKLANKYSFNKLKILNNENRE